MKTRRRTGWAGWILAALAGCLFFVPASALATRNSPKATGDPVKAFEELNGEYSTKLKEYNDAQRQAKTQAEQRKVYGTRPFPEYMPRFKVLAQEAKGTETAAKSWMRVLEMASTEEETDEASASLDVLLNEHIASPAVEGLPSVLRNSVEALGLEKTLEHLATLQTKNPSKVIQASALYTSAEILNDTGEAANAKKAHGLYEKLAKEYAALKPGKSDKTYKDMADARLFVMDNLQIGKVAPDFESIDENGAKFKLSDYRGKVVVIDFWGIW